LRIPFRERLKRESRNLLIRLREVIDRVDRLFQHFWHLSASGGFAGASAA
jgi:hypothetical protein